MESPTICLFVLKKEISLIRFTILVSTILTKQDLLVRNIGLSFTRAKLSQRSLKNVN